MIIGLTGSIGAGKDTILEYLKTQNFEYYTLSDILRKEAESRNLELTRTNLQDLGNELREKYGGGILAQKLLEKINPKKRSILSGIRNPSEIKEFKKNKNFFLISIDAPKKLRYLRVIQRNREKDPKTWEEFLKIDDRDKGRGEKQNGQQVTACIAEANFTIYNDGDIGEMNNKIKNILKEIIQIINNHNQDKINF